VRADPVGTSYQPEDDHTPDPGSICFVTGNAAPGDPAGTNDVDGGRTTLISPRFDLSGASWASVSYWRWYVDATSEDDVFRVDISADDGDTWQSLESVTESAYPWVRAVFENVGATIPLTGDMRLRFIAEDVGEGSLVEALVDDLEVVAVRDGVIGVVDGRPATPPIALDVAPRPAGARTTLRFTLPRASHVELRVYDARGALAATVVDERVGRGAHALAFPAAALRSGVYFVALRVDGREVATRKLTFVE